MANQNNTQNNTLTGGSGNGESEPLSPTDIVIGWTLLLGFVIGLLMYLLAPNPARRHIPNNIPNNIFYGMNKGEKFIPGPEYGKRGERNWVNVY
jgi:hypothetical protein